MFLFVFQPRDGASPSLQTWLLDMSFSPPGVSILMAARHAELSDDVHFAIGKQCLTQRYIFFKKTKAAYAFNLFY